MIGRCIERMNSILLSQTPNLHIVTPERDNESDEKLFYRPVYFIKESVWCPKESMIFIVDLIVIFPPTIFRQPTLCLYEPTIYGFELRRWMDQGISHTLLGLGKIKGFLVKNLGFADNQSFNSLISRHFINIVKSHGCA